LPRSRLAGFYFHVQPALSTTSDAISEDDGLQPEPDTSSYPRARPIAARSDGSLRCLGAVAVRNR
jgi:hypothetical protein